MIREIQISNFKSIDQMTISLGRINVLIGANGCGKTNILEAICLCGAAAADKLDSAYLRPRGMRYAPPRMMRSGYSLELLERPVTFKVFDENGQIYDPILSSDGDDFPQWKIVSEPEYEQLRTAIKKAIEKATANISDRDLSELSETLNDTIKLIVSHKRFASSILDFLIYAPESEAVRRLDDEERTLPLGISGSGLFRLLQSFSTEQLQEVKTHLRMIDWFDDLEIPGAQLPGERTIRISDQFLTDGLKYFEQRVANEGFLFLLFYISLFISENTPGFFGIDNLDNGLNPKLCTHLCKTLCQLADKHGKQAIITTHNPAILDGLDLKDDEQRLFVVYRNIEGRTRIRRILYSELPGEGTPVRLSEAFLRGYIGGLPKNF